MPGAGTGVPPEVLPPPDVVDPPEVELDVCAPLAELIPLTPVID